MSNKLLRILTIASVLVLNIESANSKVIQILHTNDTHSYLDHSTHNPARGGSARLKSLIDFYKTKMADAGVKSIVMDAGDFSEGNLFYMADQGRKVFEVHNEMGYDVGALGNHDYLMGTAELDKILGEMDLKYSLVAANLQINYEHKNLRAKIKPFKELEIDGVKIAVLGLTTNEIFYKWRFEGGKITNPFKSAIYYEDVLKKRKNDFIIALTHIGVENDLKLAERTKYIDLVVGGHSHTTLAKPLIAINKQKVPVPVVQAGQHTEFLGRLVADFVPGKPLKVISYELVSVNNNDSDIKIKTIVDEANDDLDFIYGKEWLDQKIGHSDLLPTDKDGARKWAYFITDAMKEKANASVAIHTPFMNGDDFPTGDVSRRDIFNSIPRVFDINDKYGWTIFTAKLKGVLLRLVFEALSHFGQPLTFSGITMGYVKTEHGIKVRELLINGLPIVNGKLYTVAFTEGIIKGAKGASPYTSLLLRSPKDTNHLIWTTLVEALSKNSGFLKIDKISEDNRLLIMPNKKAELTP